MKKIALILIITFQTALIAQTETVFGNFKKTIDTKSESIQFQLSLNENGTFVFHYSKNIHCASCSQEELQGKGTWKVKNEAFIFKSKKRKDLNEEYTVNLNNSKAKFENQKVNGVLVFFETDLSYLKGIKFIKE